VLQVLKVARSADCCGGKVKLTMRLGHTAQWPGPRPEQWALKIAHSLDKACAMRGNGLSVNIGEGFNV